jgi:hypothetical protein
LPQNPACLFSTASRRFVDLRESEKTEVDMTLQLNREQEQVVGRAIRAGLIQVPEDVLAVGVDTIRRRLEDQAVFAEITDATQWSRELRAWVRSHSTSTPLLSEEALSRDGFYGPRGM